jgi:hypothetical protein
VVSPDGSKVGTYSPDTGISRPVKLPPIEGSRRELRNTGQVRQAAQRAFPQRNITRTGIAITEAGSPWFVALDLTRDQKVTRIAALNVADETWIDEAIPEQIERSSVRIVDSYVYVIGRRVYGFSTAAKRWGVLEFPPGVDASTFRNEDQIWAEKDGRLFMFNPRTGIWDDIYARALDDNPAPAGR